MSDEDALVFNGINGATGRYLLSSLTTADISKVAQGDTLDADQCKELNLKVRTADLGVYGVREGINPLDISESGWGVVFPYSTDERQEQIRQALSPLLELRQQQADRVYREFRGASAYRPDESKKGFLSRFDKGPGPADPEKVPYYLMLVGSPEDIPYRFQYLLNVDYAVGRLDFDNVEDYARYAESVVAAEDGRYERARECSFFGVQNRDDRATQMSAKYLVAPLAKFVATKFPEWAVSTRLEDECTKEQLKNLLSGDSGPGLLFTASHGMGFPKGHERQSSHQGALLCQDWPGPHHWNGEIPVEHYFSGDDVDDVNVAGLILFNFACYSAGTPRHDDFAHQAFSERVDIADHAFVAGLPRKLLCHPDGGALAAIGHVERAWGCSFIWPGAGADLQAFEDTFERLLNGCPVGHAMEYFASRYASIATELEAEREDIGYGKTPDDLELAGMWTSNNDARSYVITGDPAVRLSL